MSSLLLAGGLHAEWVAFATLTRADNPIETSRPSLITFALPVVPAALCTTDRLAPPRSRS